MHKGEHPQSDPNIEPWYGPSKMILEEAIEEENIFMGLLVKYGPRGERVFPEDFDFPCSAVVRAYYANERYEPDREETERAERLRAELERIRWAHNTNNPYRAALASALKSRR